MRGEALPVGTGGQQGPLGRFGQLIVPSYSRRTPLQRRWWVELLVSGPAGLPNHLPHWTVCRP